MNEETIGFYYLHTNGDLIFKRFEPELASPFVKAVWRVDTTDRGCAWRIVLEGLALGAREERIKELAHKWNLTVEDSIEMILRVKPSALMMEGFKKFIRLVLGMSKEEYWEQMRKKKEETINSLMDDASLTNSPTARGEKE
jgi:hypothetical protein